jgi:uncharacterized protein (DUF433 family)
MNKKVVKLKESDIKKIVDNVIKEQMYGMYAGQYATQAANDEQQKRIANIGAVYASVKNGVITQSGSQKGKKWIDYITDYNVNAADLAAAKELNKNNQAAQQTQNTRMQNIVNTINQIDPETATIKSHSQVLNGMSFDEYMTKYNVTQADIQQAKAYVESLAKTQPEQAQKAAEVLNNVSNTPPAQKRQPDPKVQELQKTLVGTVVNGRKFTEADVDGVMGPITRAAQAAKQGTVAKSTVPGLPPGVTEDDILKRAEEIEKSRVASTPTPTATPAAKTT